MTIEEKFTGFSYQDTQKYQQEAVDKYGQEVMDQALERQKVEKRRRQEPLIKSFKPWRKTSKAGLPVTASENQEEAAKLLDAIRTYGFDCSIEVLAISAKAMSIIQNSRKISTSLELAQPSTLRMSLPFMSKINQNKK